MTPTEPPGLDCPSPVPGGCAGLGHPRFCALAGCGRPGVGPEPTPAERRYYRASLAGRSEAFRPDPAESPPSAQKPALSSPGTVPGPVISTGPGRYREKLDKIDRCPDRGPKPDCGCDSLWTCKRGRGAFRPGEVSMSDCLSCSEWTNNADSV